MLMRLLFICLFMPFLLSTPEKPPVWPSQFEQTFQETFKYPVLGSASTTGKFFYDFLNKRYRVDRANGKWDRYCGSALSFTDTPCSHFVVDSKRYLNFPEKNYCCYCCDSTQGCGILKPDWLTGAAFVGYESDAQGQSYEKWNKKGLQDNFYYATKDSRVMWKIDQEPNDIQTFDVKSLHLGISDKKALELPSQCVGAVTCPLISACTAVRQM